MTYNAFTKRWAHLTQNADQLLALIQAAGRELKPPGEHGGPG
jgi:hypothetical protein